MASDALILEKLNVELGLADMSIATDISGETTSILDTVDLPMLALNPRLTVEIANDAFLRQFRLTRETTVGRPIYELGDGQWRIPQLLSLLEQFLERDGAIEDHRVEHVFEQIGRRILRLNAKRIHRLGAKDCILLAISDETERERLRHELEGRIEFSEKLIDSVREALLILDEDLKVQSANQSFYRFFNLCPGETEGRIVCELGDGQRNIPELRRLLEDVLPQKESFDDYKIEHAFESIGLRAMLLNGRRLDHLKLIVLAIRDITEQRARDVKRHEREARQNLLIELNDRLRQLADPLAIQAVASEILGKHLGAGQATYAEIDEGAQYAVIERDWNDGTLPSNVGRHRLANFGEAIVADLKCGRTIAIGDVREDPRTAAPETLRTFGCLSISAMMKVPLVKDDRIVAMLAIHSRTPRTWSTGQVAAAEDVAERTWSVIARARAESALRDSEVRLAGLREALETALADAPLERSLGILVRMATERLGGGTRAAFYLANSEGTDLRHIVGMPAAYAEAVDGFNIGPESLTCGLATHSGLPVLTSDVAKEPRWAPWLWLADKFGYRGCWSFPILTPGGTFIGAFVVYSSQPREASTRDIELGGLITQSAAIIIGRHAEAELRKQAEEALRESERRLAQELEDARLLQGTSTGLIGDQTAQSLYARVVGAARALMRADAASIQEHHPDNKKLKLLAHVGLHPESAAFREWVDADDASACGRALMVNERIIVPDIEGFDADPQEIEAYRRSGIVAVQSTPLVSRNKRIVGMLSTHWRRRWKPSDSDIRRFDVLARLAADLIERTQAAAELRDSEARYRLLFSSIDESFTVVEPLYEEGRAIDYRFIEVNPAFETITGLKNAVGRTGRELVPSLEKEWIDAIGRVAATGNAERVIRRARALGKIYDAFIFRIDGSESGRVAILSRDVTERVRAEEERTLLMRELNHRSKNMLSIVLAIARATAGNQGRDFEEKFQERILSLSANQDLLVANDWQGVSLSDLVRSQLAHLEDLVDDRITLKGPLLIISAAASQSFSMALHELTTNAVKYGALSNADGRIEIEWGIQGHDGEGRRFTMRWRETDGPAVTLPESSGFGSTVIHDMIRLNLRGDANLKYDNSGVVWEFDCPIENVLEGQEDSHSPGEQTIAASAGSMQPNL